MEYLQQLNTFVSGGVPSYQQTFYDVKWGVEHCLKNCSGDFQPLTFFQSFKEFAVFDNAQADLGAVVGLAVVWTLLRYILTILVFQPIAKFCKLAEQDAAKYPESAFKFLVYSFTWGLSCYTIFGIPKYNHIFFEPDRIWDDYVLVQTGLPNTVQGMQVDPIIYYVYTLQISFYIHSIYATLFMDTWRKDSYLMLFHHFLTISLIGFSYLTRYHKVGLLVLFIHDPTDVVLEFTKCNVYFKSRGGMFYMVHDVISTLGFLVFSSFWYLFRLYWMPLKALHSAGYGTMTRHTDTGHLPFYFFFNGMLWILQLINIYWFLFILNFLYKVLTGQVQEVDDIREEEVMRRQRELSKQNGGSDNGSKQIPKRKAKSKKVN